MLATAGVFLSADVYDTPGLPGYRTYDLTATTADGYLNGFDFGAGGIGGSLYQNPTDDLLFGGPSGGSADSHWRVNASDGFAVQAKQSASDLSAAFVFSEPSGLRDTYRSLPFARLVTNDPSAVRIEGSFVLARRYNDTAHGFGSSVLAPVATWLSEVSTAGVPTLGSFAEPLGPDSVTIAADPVAAHEADWARGRAAAAEASDWGLLDDLHAWGTAAAQRGDTLDEWLANRAADTDWRVGEVIAEPAIPRSFVTGLTLSSMGASLHPGRLPTVSSIGSVLSLMEATDVADLNGLARATTIALNRVRAAEARDLSATIHLSTLDLSVPITTLRLGEPLVMARDLIAIEVVPVLGLPVLDLGGGALSAIPEPGGVVLALVALVGIVGRQRR